MCAQFEILKVKLPINFLGTVDFSLPRDGRYYKAQDLRGSVTWRAGIHSRSPVTHIKFMWTQFWSLDPRLGGYLARMISLSSCGTLRLA